MYLIRVGFNSTNGVNPPIGTMYSIQCDYPPEGWIECKGQSIEELIDYPALQLWMRGQSISRLPLDEEVIYKIVPIKPKDGL